MAYPKVRCDLCGQFITKNNFSKHTQRHINNPDSFNHVMYHLDHEDLICKFCDKGFKNKNSLVQHEIRCIKNLDRINVHLSGFNNTGRAAWNKGLTKETDERVKKLGESIRQCHINFPERFTGFTNSSRKSKYKYGTYNGFYCDSSWELAFILWNIDNNIYFKRNTKDYFIYTVNNKSHKFYPDFIIDTNTYVEIKGGYDIHALDKIGQFPKDKNLVVLDNISIKPYLDYCIDKYGKEFYTLYDRNYPSWMDK